MSRHPIRLTADERTRAATFAKTAGHIASSVARTPAGKRSFLPSNSSDVFPFSVAMT